MRPRFALLLASAAFAGACGRTEIDLGGPARDAASVAEVAPPAPDLGALAHLRRHRQAAHLLSSVESCGNQSRLRFRIIEKA